MNAGAAEIDITPDFAVDLSGFALRTQPSTGVIEPIFARALYLNDGPAEKLLWIGCDVVALEREFVDRFRAWAKAELKLGPHQVLLSATHTHSAPATIHLSGAGEYSERYVSLLAGKVRDVARRAVGKARPCEIVAGSSALDLAVDRRHKPTSHVDPTVWCVAFRAPTGAGAFSAAVLNYTMHPVSLGHIQRGISPDWCGAASRVLSATLPGKPVALVSNGAAGNINPPGLDQDPDAVRGWGEQVGNAAGRALASAKLQADDSAMLRVRSVTVPVPLEAHAPDEIDRIADEYIQRMKDFVWGEPFRTALNTWRVAMKRTVAGGGGETVPIEMQAIRIGGAARIVTVNGEMFTRFTDYVRRATTHALFTVAYANAAFGYIPTREAYAEGGYEVETAHFFYNSFRPKPGGLELLAERAIELVKSLDQ